MDLLDILANDNYIMYNKTLAREIGVENAIVFGCLCSAQRIAKSEEFYREQSKIIEETALTEYLVRKSIKELQEYGLLSVTKKGLPAKYYFKVKVDKLIGLLTTSGAKSDTTGHCESSTTNKNKEEKKENNIINNITKEKPKKERKAREFTPPTADEVNAYSKEKGYSVDGQMFVDYYDANNWISNGKPIVNWKLKVVTWESKNRERKKTNIQPKRDWSKEMECHNYTEEEINSHMTSLSNLNLEDL